MSVHSLVADRTASAPLALKPMKLGESLVLFAVPAALMTAGIYGVWPALVRAGLPSFDAYAYTVIGVYTLLLLAALVAYVAEGNPLTWQAFSARYRLHRLGPGDGRWTLACLGIMAALSLLVTTLLQAGYSWLGFVPPAISAPATNVLLVAVLLVCNVAGEELWWRGYILPRQELAFGRYAWLLHGTLWAGFHLFKWFDVPGMLLTCQVIPFLAQHRRNTTPGLLIHLVLNGAPLPLMLLALLK